MKQNPFGPVLIIVCQCLSVCLSVCLAVSSAIPYNSQLHLRCDIRTGNGSNPFHSVHTAQWAMQMKRTKRKRRRRQQRRKRDSETKEKQNKTWFNKSYLFIYIHVFVILNHIAFLFSFLCYLSVLKSKQDRDFPPKNKANPKFNPFSPTLSLIVAKMSLPKRSAPYWSNPPF